MTQPKNNNGVIELDYKKLGLRCGIEIHQQLEGKKLFCNSPTLIRDDEPDFTVKRKLRAVIGESGKLDEAAKKEMEKNKTYVYQGYSDTNGLVELDEEPPKTLNQDALDTTLQISKLLDAQIVDEVQIMRKNVVDGSNTSGFQRTALVSQHGTLYTSKNKPISVPTIIVEEDACKKVREEGNTVIYNLSRLGIPLIEIGTGPDINDPYEAREVSEKLGMMLRSTGRVKRGLGTIRQDVNVSIKGGARVEVKGAQDLAGIPNLIDNEIIRQINILDLKAKFKKMVDSKAIAQDLTSVFSKTASEIIKKNLNQKAKVFGVKIPNAKDLFGTEIQPNKRIGKEIADYLKVHYGLGGIIHHDEDLKSKYNFSTEEIAAITKKLDVKSSDGFALMITNEQTNVTGATSAIFQRLQMFADGVPSEVRRANPDYSTTYMRPMPGEARMYPETDCLPIKVDADHIVTPELIEAKIQRFIDEYKLGVDLATAIAKGQDADLFEQLTKAHDSIKPATVAETIESVPKTIKRKDKIEINPTEDDYNALFAKLADSSIAVSSIPDVLKAAHGSTVKKVISKFELMSDSELKKIIDDVKAQHPDAPMGLLMGKIMAATKGKADGRKVQERLRS